MQTKVKREVCRAGIASCGKLLASQHNLEKGLEVVESFEHRNTTLKSKFSLRRAEEESTAKQIPVLRAKQRFLKLYITKQGSQNRFMWIPILITVEIRSYDSLSINKSKAAILAINRYIKGLLVVPQAKNSANEDIMIKNSFSGLAEQPQSFEHNKCKADKRNSSFSPIDLSYSERVCVLCEASRPVAKGAQRTRKEDKGILKENATIGCTAKHKQVSSNSNELLTLCTQEKYFSFPTKRKMFTVLRSPHIDKKSREHFQWKQSKITVFLEFKKPGEWDLFLFILENARLPGVQLLVGCQYSTFCAF